MKNVLSVLPLAVVMSLGLIFGCGDDDSSENSSSDSGVSGSDAASTGGTGTGGTGTGGTGTGGTGTGDGCEYLGVQYDVGASIASGDGCNTCSCSSGGMVACTLMACLCDSSGTEPSREYMGESAEQCATIRYACPESTTSFSNSCGCGCEQDPSCPEWFNCMPGPGSEPCDTEQIAIDCPYSGIAY